MPDPVSARVLLADDQQDVATTLGALLIASGMQVALAPDGESALARIRAEPFDLVVVDMKMPPGEWGGVWLLRQLAEQFPLLPSIVLTGEGTQEQTVEALRAGALDWVRKDEARQRLVEAVTQIASKAQQRALDAGQGRWPAPIAISFARFGAAAPANTKLHLALNVVDSVLRSVCAIGLIELRQANLAQELPPSLRAQLLRPSFGTWLELSVALGRVAPSSASFHSWIQCLEVPAIRSLVKLRNDLVHGFEPSEAAARDLTASIAEVLRKSLSRASSYVDSVFTVPLTLEFDGRQFSAHCVDLVGSALAFPQNTRVLSAATATGRAVLITGDGEVLAAGPWLRAEPSAVHGEWEVLMLDGVNAKRRELAVGDQLRYVALASAERRALPAEIEDVEVLRSFQT